MFSVNVFLAVCLGYVALLFVVAFIVDRRARTRPIAWLQSPMIYTLSISVYCTSWTFYGAVGSAARNGLEFITIYLGPTLVFIGWWWCLRKLVRIGRAHKITSIADLISSRYGKSASIAVVVTVIALVATTPYMALQLQSVTRSYQVIAHEADGFVTAFWIAAGMALFTIVFGTRNLDANERHHGVVAAIALEAIVKLIALVAVGVYATWGLGSGLSALFENVSADAIRGGADIFGPRWATLMFLSATAVICLPRQFQVTVVENIEERHLQTASWLFPLYLLGMTLFIMPIALIGLQQMPAGSNPDLYVLTLPLSQQRDELALLAFLGGFSSATSMVIVAAIAVSTMVSNHIVLPLALKLMARDHAVSGDVRNLLLVSRRISIAVILALGYLYFRLSGGSDALAAIGLIAFVGVAQFLPSLLGGIFWRGATRVGALSGLLTGTVFWAYTLFLPSFGGDFVLSTSVINNGPFGIDILRPQALFGLTGWDPLVHAVVLSVGLNLVVFVIVSSLTEAAPLERIQGGQFVDIFRIGGGPTRGFAVGNAQTDDLFLLAQRILGTEPARRLFSEMSASQGNTSGLPYATNEVIARLERELSGSIGAASAHAMVTGIAGGKTLAVTELIDIADETQRLMVTTRELAEKSSELERAAEQLRDANERLRALDLQKDEFLSQVSHELRTPMTSIRSFSEILKGDDVSASERQRFVSIIHEESLRLTRLLDEILDLGRFEAGIVDLDIDAFPAESAMRSALDAVDAMVRSAGVKVDVAFPPESRILLANSDRLRQVLINLLSNAVKYNSNPSPEIRIDTHTEGDFLVIDVDDNGGGVSRDEAELVFEKFSRGRAAARTDRGAGLGLPISRAYMNAMNGDLTLEFEPRSDHSFFRLRIPLQNAPESTRTDF